MGKIKITLPILQALTSKVKDIIIERPVDLAALKITLVELLEFLTTPEGRTDQNCREVDLYFCLHDEDGFTWDHLPDEFQLILADIGGALHDTVKDPEIAWNFESTPEQLLERVKKINIENTE